ncbi:hypothetical protein FHT00_002585 [Sphingomonas insulae]|uniref:Helix-turn-helix domain-containing protein n=1 Tax=Sphingomonas insulae TaxID=424800 RepID=A0ABP3T415_9SPHN|nr:hypothetical protein [Sphingomonas insulae]NIJ30614.1 hypothetical protein [Sphingomonas insulae]
MAKEFIPWSREKNARVLARDEAQRAETDRCILAGIEASEKGEDIATAVNAARDKPKRMKNGDDPEDFAPLLEPRKIRADGWTPDMLRAFITALAETGSVSEAARIVGVSRNTAYAMRHRAPHSVFSLAWDVAVQLSRKRLLDVAIERATQGQEVAVWYHGEQVGTRVVHNDRLLTFLLGQTPAPVHPTLPPHELAAMFPTMLAMIDTQLAHPVAMRLKDEREAAEAGEDDDY